MRALGVGGRHPATMRKVSANSGYKLSLLGGTPLVDLLLARAARGCASCACSGSARSGTSLNWTRFAGLPLRLSFLRAPVARAGFVGKETGFDARLEEASFRDCDRVLAGEPAGV